MTYRIETDAQPEDFGNNDDGAVRQVSIYRGDQLLYQGSFATRNFVDPFQMISQAITAMYMAAHAYPIK